VLMTRYSFRGIGIDQLFLSRRGKPSRHRAEHRDHMKESARQDFARGFFLEPFPCHNALYQLVDGIFGAKPNYCRQLAIAWHTFMAPIESPSVCEMFCRFLQKRAMNDCSAIKETFERAHKNIGQHGGRTLVPEQNTMVSSRETGLHRTTELPGAEEQHRYSRLECTTEQVRQDMTGSKQERSASTILAQFVHLSALDTPFIPQGAYIWNSITALR